MTKVAASFSPGQNVVPIPQPADPDLIEAYVVQPSPDPNQPGSARRDDITFQGCGNPGNGWSLFFSFQPSSTAEPLPVMATVVYYTVP